MATDASVPLSDITQYLDAYLRIGAVADEANAVNGLQAENAGRIDRVVAAVDASLETIERAERRRGVRVQDAARGTLLLVHHGLLWDGNLPLTGRRYRRIRALLDRNIALYSAHIPLDLHPEVGNNAVLARRLGMEVEGWFGDYRGQLIGVWGQLQIARDALVRRLDELLTTSARLIPGGPAITSRVGIVTGGAGAMVAKVASPGLDTFISGEGPHHTFFDAMEGGVNLIYAGHYATEQVGVQALAEHIGLKFELPWEFHHHPTGL